VPNLCPISFHPLLGLPCTAHHICTSQSLWCPTEEVFLLLHHYRAARKLQWYLTAISKIQQFCHRHLVRRKTAVTATASWSEAAGRSDRASRTDFGAEAWQTQHNTRGQILATAMPCCRAVRAHSSRPAQWKQAASLVYQMQHMERKSMEAINFQHILEIKLFSTRETRRKFSNVLLNRAGGGRFISNLWKGVEDSYWKFLISLRIGVKTEISPLRYVP